MCAPDADCSVCEGEYFPSLSHTCARCSESRRQWFVAIAAIAGIALSSAIVVILVYLVSTNFEQQKSTRILHQIGQAVPVQAFKGVIVVWQILTQARSATDRLFLPEAASADVFGVVLRLTKTTSSVCPLLNTLGQRIDIQGLAEDSY